MNALEKELAAVKARLAKLEGPPRKSDEEYIDNLQGELDQGPGRVRNSLDAELAKNDRAREVKQLREISGLIKKFGGTPANYSPAQFTKAWRLSGFNSAHFHNQLRDAAQLEVEEAEAETGEAPKEPEK
jgi:hypothetical protein